MTALLKAARLREKRHAARRAARTAVASRFVVLTGLSGAGKSQAIRALEDLGYFCVDNLPVALLPMLAELTLRAGNEIARAAVVVDVREGKMLDEHFFDLADRYGIMVMPGWCCCAYWEQSDNWKPEDFMVAGESLRSQLRRLRNHASVFVFLYGSDSAPNQQAEQVYLKVLT